MTPIAEVGYFEPWWMQVLKSIVIFAIGLQLARRQRRQPVPAHQVAHHGARADAGQRLGGAGGMALRWLSHSFPLRASEQPVGPAQQRRLSMMESTLGARVRPGKRKPPSLHGVKYLRKRPGGTGAARLRGRAA